MCSDVIDKGRGTMRRVMASIALAVIFAAGGAAAQSSPYLVSPNGQYLGNLNGNRYDPNSVSNPYGQYGSQYSPNSINNPYGQYGSPYSPQSAHNPYATQAPMVIAPQGGTRAPCFGYGCR